MSNQYPGGFVTRTPPVVTTSSAPGVWTLSQQAGYQKLGVWPLVPVGWAGAFTSGDSGIFYAASFDSSGNIVNYGWDSTTSTIILQKLNPTTGTQTWVRTYASSVATMADPYQLNANGRFVFTDSSNNIYAGYCWSLDGGGIFKTNSSGTFTNAVYSKPGFLYAWNNIGFTSSTLKFGTQWLSTNGYQNIHTFNTSLSNTGNTRYGGVTAEGAYSCYLSTANVWWGQGQLGNSVNDNLMSKDIAWNKLSITGASGYAGSSGAIAEDSSGNIYWTYQLTGGNTYIVKTTTTPSVTWCYLLSQASVSFRGTTMDASNKWYVISSSTTSNASLLNIINSSGAIVLQQRFAMTGGSNFTLYSVSVDSAGANMLLVGRLDSRPFAMYIPTTGAANATWVIGSSTITCTNVSEWTLSSVSASISSYSNSSYSSFSPSTETMTTNTTPTLTWSR
jgi:hypothetical protein